MSHCLKCNNASVLDAGEEKILSVGKEIYVPTFEDYGFVGGLAKVKQVLVKSMLVIEEWGDNIVLNWPLLEPHQNELRKKFGLQKASLDSDFEEKQRRMGNSCPLNIKTE